MSDYDLSPLTACLKAFAPQGRTALLPALHAAQAIYGYLPEPVAAEVGRTLGVPLAEVHGVIEFYHMFHRHPVGKRAVLVCTDPACALAGGEALLEAACQTLGAEEGCTSADGRCTVHRAPCLGLCDHAPAALSGETAVGRLTFDQLAALGSEAVNDLPGAVPRTHIVGAPRLLTALCGQDHSVGLDEYRAAGGYQGLARALALSPAEVIAEVKASGLVGRGGAAFPTGVKWESAAVAPGRARYVVCNADESEPGTFKDRVLMEDDPHRTLEGMAITAYAIGAAKGYIYVRGEYPRAFAALQRAVADATADGLLGRSLLGSGFAFEIELRMGAGAYLCGEETALFESIEGKRGFPRLKPPFPTTHGLFGQPTVINNVETLCNLPWIMQHGAAAYRQFGSEKSPGTKLFCVSGDVVSPALVEAPFGLPLNDLIAMCGGPLPGRSVQAVLVGGAAGAFAIPQQLDTPLSFEAMRAAGLPLGSGVALVLDDSRDLRQVLAGLGRFFAVESCGKCYPCQIGTQRQYEILQRVAAGAPLPGDVARLQDLAATMTDASICGLGQTAGSAVISAMRLWPQYFETPA